MCAIGACATSASAARPPSVSPSGRLAFVSVSLKAFTISTVGLDGQRPRVVAKSATPSFGQRPAWSPDGRRIAFVCSAFELCVMNADGSGARMLTRTHWPSRREYHGAAAWSPDGTKIAFSSNSSGHYRIYVVPAGGGRIERLGATAGGDDSDPAWSPDGMSLSFDSRKGRTFAVYVAPTQGGAARRVSPAGADARHPDWSPDSRWIAFSSRGRKGSRIELVRPSGQGLRQLTAGSSRDDHPAWSPDGKWIAFDSNRGGTLGLWLLKRTGGRPTVVHFAHAGPVFYPAWTTAGRKASRAPRRTPPQAVDPDAMLVTSFVLWTTRLGADLIQLGSSPYVASSHALLDGARGEKAITSLRPPDLRAKQLQRAAVIAIGTGGEIGLDFRRGLAALQQGDKQAARAHFQTALGLIHRYADRVTAAENLAHLLD
jgi:Tol biopolymer transport system component